MYSLLVWGIPLAGALALAMLLAMRSQTGILSLKTGRELVGPHLFDTLVKLHLFLWVMPFSGLLILPFLAVSQLIDSRARDSWRTEPRPKAAFVSVWLLILLACATLPFSSFEAPSEWGEPLVVDDTSTPFWPTTEQKVWLLDRDQSSPIVVTVMHKRLPATFSAWGTAEFSAWATEVFDMDESRLSETARQLGVDAEDFELIDIESEGHHRYRSADGAIDVDLSAARRNIVTDFPFDGTVVGELVTIYVPQWGGEMWVLTITRSSSSSEVDPWAESIMLEWLAVQQDQSSLTSTR